MSLFHCRFCDHDNPSGARFCNECGSPLYLKPCPQCEAVNETAASQCYQCGAALPKQDAADEASVASMPELVGATENAGDVGGAQRRTEGAFTERFEIEFGEFRPSLFSDTPSGAMTQGGATSGAAATGDHHETRTSSGAAHRRDSVTRTALTSTGALLVLALIVVGAAAYYAYQYSTAPTKGADVVAASPASAQQEPAATEVKPPSATSNAVAPPPVATAPEADSMKGAANDEPATTLPTPAPQESVGPRTEPAPVGKAKSTPQSRRGVTAATGKSTAAQATRPAASSDASAAATQRIIERELGIRGAPPPSTRAP